MYQHASYMRKLFTGIAKILPETRKGQKGNRRNLSTTRLKSYALAIR